MKLIRKFKLGHLFFKYIQGTELENLEPYSTSKKLAHEMMSRDIIVTYTEDKKGLLVLVEKASKATWYAYRTGMEPTKKELIELLLKTTKEIA